MKLNQTFVLKKFTFLMVRSLFKWFAAGMFLLPAIYAIKQPVLLLSSKAFHPFYVSVTEFNHNQKENTLEISCKLYADDFENTLKTQYKTVVDISNPKDTRQVEKLVYDYLHKRLILKINGRPATTQFVGFEKENEAVWCYLQVNNVAQLKKLEITNSLLYEMYDTQIGIIHAMAGGARKSIRLIHPHTNAVFEW